jgi:hypothetical protein
VSQSCSDQARDAIRGALETDHDFGGWLAAALASVAAELGSSDALTTGRPGSREADLVRHLLNEPSAGAPSTC